MLIISKTVKVNAYWSGNLKFIRNPGRSIRLYGEQCIDFKLKTRPKNHAKEEMAGSGAEIRIK